MLNVCANICNLCTKMINNVKFVRKIHQNSPKTESTKNQNFSKIPEKNSKIQNCSFPYVNTVNLNVN